MSLWIVGLTTCVVVLLHGCGGPSPTPSPPSVSSCGYIPDWNSTAHYASANDSYRSGSSFDKGRAWVDGLADAALEGLLDVVAPEALVAQLVDLCVETFENEIKEVFTHARTITVVIGTDQPMLPLTHTHDYKDDGVDFAGSQVDGGLGIVFHADGPISGCQGFAVQGCDYQLIVAASNPLVGYNKARVEFKSNAELGDRSCYEVWDDMDSWGEFFGSVNKLTDFDDYENPGKIHYQLLVPEECRCGAPSPSPVPPPPPTPAQEGCPSVPGFGTTDDHMCDGEKWTEGDFVYCWTHCSGVCQHYGMNRCGKQSDYGCMFGTTEDLCWAPLAGSNLTTAVQV